MNIIAETNCCLHSCNFTKDNANLYILGFNGIKKLKYKDELKGETNNLKELTSLSAELSSIIVCGMLTDNYGIIKQSVAVAERGKLLGISDMNTTLENSLYMPSGGQKIYNTSMGKLGIIVSDDIYNYDYIRAFTLCNCDCIICILEKCNIEMPLILLRAYSYLSGLPISLITIHGVYACNNNGEITYSSQTARHEYEIIFNDEYHLISTKTKFNK